MSAIQRSTAGVLRAVTRGHRTASLSTAVSFKDFGNPDAVLKAGPASAGKPGKGSVAVKMVAAPIYPSDLSAVRAKGKGAINAGTEKVRYVNLKTFQYSHSAAAPGVGGNAGVGVVTSVGSGVEGLSEGDMVVPVAEGLGTWAEELVAPAKSLTKVPAGTSPEAAATLDAKTTAYCLLNDFVGLEAGDVIIQDAAESAVGTAVVQLAKEMGVKVISVVEDSVFYEDTANRLKGMGGDEDIVISSYYLRTGSFFNLIADMKSPKLALSGAGGYISTKLARSLNADTTMVLYGANEDEAVRVPAEIAAGVKVEGFWLSKKSAEERAAIAPKVLDVNVWVENYPFSSYSQALENAADNVSNRTVVVKM